MGLRAGKDDPAMTGTVVPTDAVDEWDRRPQVPLYQIALGQNRIPATMGAFPHQIGPRRSQG